jgi:hypothetical protein
MCSYVLSCDTSGKNEILSAKILVSESESVRLPLLYHIVPFSVINVIVLSTSQYIQRGSYESNLDHGSKIIFALHFLVVFFYNHFSLQANNNSGLISIF